MSQLGCKYSYLEIDVNQLRRNLQNMRAVSRYPMIPVAKSNAWSLGTVPIAKLLFNVEGYRAIAVAHVTEAIEIREAGYREQTIMLLSGAPFHAIPYIVKYRLLMMVFNVETVERLSREVKAAGLDSFAIQIKVDTGFHRTGVSPEHLPELLNAIEKAGNLQIIGICSHYADSYDKASEKTDQQYAVFKKTVEYIRSRGYEPKYISIGCSADLEREDDVCNCVRVGWGYIAYTQDPGMEEYYGNQSVMSLRTFITDIHELKPGDTLGYANVKLTQPATVATICMGYGDGLYRPLVLHRAPLLIRGQYAHYLDECMDQTIIDITGLNCQVGDEVTIYGKDKYTDTWLSQSELAGYADGHSTVLQHYLSERVARIYTGMENEI